jgi:acetyl-CoA acetyltransferase
LRTASVASVVPVVALWLEDEQSTADLVMVMPPVPKDFTPFSAMPVPPFVASLERLAALVPAEDRKARSRTQFPTWRPGTASIAHAPAAPA